MLFGEVLQLIAGILVVIFGAYYATYIIANRKVKRSPGAGINVRERFSLSKDKMVCVLEVRGKAYLVVVTNGGATLLDTFDVKELGDVAEEKKAYTGQEYMPHGAIARIIRKLWNSIKKAVSAKTSGANSERREDTYIHGSADDEFGFRRGRPEIRKAREEDGIDEIQRRLKNRMATTSETEEAPFDE